jgi:hypothetical protein
MNERILKLPEVDLNLPLGENINLANEKYQIVKKFDMDLEHDGESVDNCKITEEVAYAVGTLREILAFEEIRSGLPRKTIIFFGKIVRKYGEKVDAFFTEKLKEQDNYSTL